MAEYRGASSRSKVRMLQARRAVLLERECSETASKRIAVDDP